MQEKHLELYQQAVEGCDSRLRLKMCSLAAMNGVEDFHSFILLSSSGEGTSVSLGSSQWLQHAVLIAQHI